jgi:hypothetical protein
MSGVRARVLGSASHHSVSQGIPLTRGEIHGQPSQPVQRFAFASHPVHHHCFRGRPVLEVLEVRIVLSTFTVNSLGDVGSDSADSGDLRYCINQTNANDQANTIVFDSTIFGTPRMISLSGGQLELKDSGETQTITRPATGVTISGGGDTPSFRAAASRARFSSTLIRSSSKPRFFGKPAWWPAITMAPDFLERSSPIAHGRGPPRPTIVDRCVFNVGVLRGSLQIRLEVVRVFAEIMPFPGKFPPGAGIEGRRKTFRELGDLGEVLVHGLPGFRSTHAPLCQRGEPITNPDGPLRQLTVAELGHEEPTLLLTNQLSRSASHLIGRHAQRMLIENNIEDAIDFFHMDALSSAVAMKVNCDLQLTLMASSLYRLLAVRIGNRYEVAKSRHLFRDFVDASADHRGRNRRAVPEARPQPVAAGGRLR